MNPDQLVAVIGGITALVVALASLFRQVHLLRLQVDGRLTELLEITKSSAAAAGRLEGVASTVAIPAPGAPPPKSLQDAP